MNYSNIPWPTIKQFDDNGLRELLLDDDVLTCHKNEAIDELIRRAIVGKVIWVVDTVCPVAYDNYDEARKHAAAEATDDGYCLPITKLVVKSAYEPKKD